MKIGYAGAPTSSAITSKEIARKADKSAEALSAKPIETSPDVTLSSQARSLAARGSASFDQGRVAELRSARSSGELSLDVPAVAKRLEEEN